jgi:hypothetical protein
MLRSLSAFSRKKHREMRRESGLKWYKVDRPGVFGRRRVWIPEHELSVEGDSIISRDDHRPSHLRRSTSANSDERVSAAV